MRHRFFGQDPRYIALKELNGEGKYLRGRTSLDSIADDNDSAASSSSEAYTPTLKKRMSYAFVRRPSFSRRPSRLSLASSTQWKRASLSRAVTATRDVFGALPLGRRSSHSDDEPAAAAPAVVDEVDKKRQSWIHSWMNASAPDLTCKFALPHSTLFVPV